MAAIPRKSVALISLFSELKNLHLRQVKKLTFTFDPFHEDSHSLRNFLFHVSSKRKRKTNEICILKTVVVNDRSEPLLNVSFDKNETEVIFKTANLSTLEIAHEFNKIVERFYVPEEPTLSPLLSKKTSSKRSR